MKTKSFFHNQNLGKGVKQLVQDYEDYVILPPLEFRDRQVVKKLVPLPRTIKPVPAPRTKQVVKKTVPVPITKIEQKTKLFQVIPII